MSLQSKHPKSLQDLLTKHSVMFTLMNMLTRNNECVGGATRSVTLGQDVIIAAIVLCAGLVVERVICITSQNSTFGVVAVIVNPYWDTRLLTEMYNNIIYYISSSDVTGECGVQGWT